MSKPIPKAIASAVTLTVAVAALLTFTRGDKPEPNALSAAVVPGVSGTTAPNVSGHTPKPTATQSPSAEQKAAKLPTGTSRSSTSARPTHSTATPHKTTKPTPSPSSTPTENGLLTFLDDVLHTGH